jgi:CheY-like chemotaxis protein
MNEHILVVEDDEHLAAVVRDGLAHYGYTVTLSATGTQALAVVRTRPSALATSSTASAAALSGTGQLIDAQETASEMRTFRVPMSLAPLGSAFQCLLSPLCPMSRVSISTLMGFDNQDR